MTRAILVLLALGVGATPSRFDELKLILAREPGDGDLRVRQFIERAGGTPIIEGSTAVFLVEGDPGAPPRIVGDFNGWGEGKAGAAGATLERLGSTRYFFRRVELPMTARIEYLVASGGREVLDPRNPRRVEAFSESHSELRMPGYAPLANTSEEPAVPRGRVVSFEHTSELRGNTRRVDVYLPPEYDADPRRVYPEAWLGDGTVYVEGLSSPRILDHLIAEGRLEPLVAVFVDPVDRRLEYGVHAGFRRMMVSELVPRIAREYRVTNLPERRLVAGGSRGGQAAIDLWLDAPEVFGLCGAWAPAVAPRQVTELLAGRSSQARAVLIRALYDDEWGPDAPMLRDRLTALGARVTYLEEPQGHNRGAWPDFMARVLIEAFPGPRPAPGAGQHLQRR